jgi:hypothetical protein
MASALAVLLLLPAAATALMYDVVDRAKLPPAECTAGCARWTHLIEDGAVLPPMKAGWWESRFEDQKIWPSNQSTIDAQWAGGKPPAGIGSACANPALTSLVAWPPYPREAPGTDASFCFCAKARRSQWRQTRRLTVRTQCAGMPSSQEPSARDTSASSIGLGRPLASQTSHCTARAGLLCRQTSTRFSYRKQTTPPTGNIGQRRPWMHSCRAIRLHTQSPSVPRRQPDVLPNAEGILHWRLHAP